MAIFPGLLYRLGVQAGIGFLLQCDLFFLGGLAVGAFCYESTEGAFVGAVIGWLGYSMGQFAALMVFGAWNWFFVYALGPATIAMIPATADLLGGAGRKLIQPVAEKPPTCDGR
jgi:hypothetical protein